MLEQLTGLERGPAPRWDTFCGVSGGAWQGQVAAFSPVTGEAQEPAHTPHVLTKMSVMLQTRAGTCAGFVMMSRNDAATLSTGSCAGDRTH